MALTTLDPNTALLVVDLQKGIVGSPVAAPFRQVVDRAKALIDAFRARRRPIVLINVAGASPGRTEQPRRHADVLAEGFTDLIPELDPQPDDIVVTKRTRGAFASTDLEARLRAIGVTQVVILGVATAAGVESTARQAYEAGFNVTLAVDAMADPRPEAHAYSLGNVFPRLGETGTSQEIIDLLAKGSDSHAVA
jgi:nicotinamidase-related amidase